MSKANMLQRFLRLDAGRRWLCVRSISLAWVLTKCLKLCGYSTLTRLIKLAPKVRLGQNRLISEVILQEVIWSVNVATSLIPGSGNCLIRAITLKLLLMQHGISCDLKIGVLANTDQGINGHAWVEITGKTIYGDTPGTSFEPLGCLSFD